MAASATPPDRQSVIDYALGLGFHLAGIASVPESPSDPEARAVAHLQTWLKQGHQADMAWMANPKRQDIRQVLPGARSLICVALNYYTPQTHSPDPRHGKIARYAWGRDYHRVLHKRLKALAGWLTTAALEARAGSRDTAQQAGSGVPSAARRGRGSYAPDAAVQL